MNLRDDAESYSNLQSYGCTLSIRANLNKLQYNVNLSLCIISKTIRILRVEKDKWRILKLYFIHGYFSLVERKIIGENQWHEKKTICHERFIF